MPIPESVQIVCRTAAEKNVENIEAAVAEAYDAVLALPEWPDFRDALVMNAIRAMVHDVRHNDNVKMRRECGTWTTIPKSTMASIPADVMISVWGYNIAGRTLGTILGEELDQIAQDEAARADGHNFNARLCRKLKSLVPTGKTVKQAVSEAKMRKLFKQEQAKT